eukprot:CAMPEP_0113587560 /NCGR_PEP_ID=MMETSP0015_2-20120614/34979_1 /TAXON_ID=2838 /ORGANISM="Odontella" /LENGTH=74 /DNA_ID=CAMNT_0000493239 /DNA_START=38 /DNA_END=262 /DNA_ORIENTATION=+ /assembly_acc=CAM_ASM_000160
MTGETPPAFEPHPVGEYLRVRWQMGRDVGWDRGIVPRNTYTAEWDGGIASLAAAPTLTSVRRGHLWRENARLRF